MKLSYDDLMDEDFDSFEKFTGSKRNMNDSAPHDKNKGQAIRTKRKEREDMKAEQEKANQEKIDL